MDNQFFPLTFAQERLWFLERLEPGTPRYSITSAFKLNGMLDIEHLKSAITETVSRHPALRARITVIDGKPLQYIVDDTDFQFAIHDLSTLRDTDKQHSEIISLASVPIQLEEGGLFRVHLFRTAEREFILLFLLHHIVGDGWSTEVLFRDVDRLYAALVKGDELPAPYGSLDYRDHVEQQRNWVETDSYQENLSYWRDTLQGVPDQLALPTDFTRPLQSDSRGLTVDFELDAETTQSLRSLSKQSNVTLYMILLTAYQILLHRYSAQELFTVGTPVAERKGSETADLIGFLVNTLVLKCDITEDPTFSELLKRTRTTMIGAYQHQSMPLEKLVEELQPGRDVGRNPLFQSMFILQNTPDAILSLTGLDVSIHPLDLGYVKFDLSLEINDRVDLLSCRFKGLSDIFQLKTLKAASLHFHAIISCIIDDPDQPVSLLEYLTDEEHERIIYRWSGKRTTYPEPHTITGLFNRSVEDTPNNSALKYGEVTTTYRQLDDLSNMVANRLLECGLKPSDIIAVMLPRSPDLIAIMLGIMKAGGIYLPVDYDNPTERISYILEDAEPFAVVCGAHHSVDWDKIILIDSSLVNPKNGNYTPPQVVRKPDDPLYIIYTSGSTGQPKGALNSHRAFAYRFHWAATNYPLPPEANLLFKSNIAFDASLIEIFWALSNSSTLHIVDSELSLNPVKLVKYIKDNDIVHLHGVPSFLSIVAENPQLSECKALVRVHAGGEPLLREFAEKLRQITGAKVVNGYGPTECSIGITYHTYNPDEKTDIVPIGRPLDNGRVYVLDNNFQPVPANVIGDLYIGGDWVGLGYHKRPELTAERYLPDPFSSNPSDRIYWTGDLAKFDHDGILHFAGRRDGQVKVRGFRIETGEIEAELLKITGILQCAVVVKGKELSEQFLQAFIRTKEDVELDITAIRSQLTAKLPAYMIPASFSKLSTFPKLASGKTDRLKLANLDIDDTTRFKTEYAPPRDQLDLRIQRIWSDVLGVNPIGINDNFFEIGGHSLLAVKLFAELEELTGKNIPLATLFLAPTISQLADILRDEGWSPPPEKYFVLNGEGGGTPMFLIPPAGSAGLHFVELTRLLNPYQPVYVLLPSGMEEDKDPPHAEIVGIAKVCLDVMREVRPEGPYLLGGSCFGGYVAFEMAQQLRLEHVDVLLLMLFDVHGPGFKRTENMLLFHMRKLYQIPTEERVEYIRDRGKGIKRRVDHVTHRTARFVNTKLGVPLPKSLRNSRRMHILARYTYRPSPYHGKAIIFQAKDQPEGFAAKMKGWEGLLVPDPQVVEVPGRHDTMMHGDNLSVVATELNAVLDKVEMTRVG